MEKLWRKRFGDDLPIEDRYKEKLLDVDNWEYYDSEGKFLYTLNPDYCIYLVNDSYLNEDFKINSFSLSQDRIDIKWNYLELRYKNECIKPKKHFLVAYLNGYRFVTVNPLIGSVNDFSENMYFRFILANSLNFFVEYFLLNNNNGYPSLHPEYIEKNKLLKNIVIFRDNNQKNEVMKLLKDRMSEIVITIEPSEEQLQAVKRKIRTISENREIADNEDYLVRICKEKILANI